MKPLLAALIAIVIALALFSPASVSATAQLNATTSCTTNSTFEATFYWSDIRSDTTQVQLQLSYYENGWRPNTYQTSGWRSPDTNRLTWPDLPTGRTYFFGLQQGLTNGTAEISPTYYVESPTCATPGKPAAITAPDSAVPIVNCGLQTCMVDEATGLITVPSDVFCALHNCPQVAGAGGAACLVPYVGNGRGPTVCEDGCVSRSAGSGTCSYHGGIARPR